MRDIDNDSGLVRELIGDGRPPLLLTAVILFLSGAFAIFLSIRREFLPHDVAFLGMSAEALCAHVDCRLEGRQQAPSAERVALRADTKPRSLEAHEVLGDP